MYNVNNRGTWVQRIWELSVLTLQLFCTSKTVLQNKVHLKNLKKFKQKIHTKNNNNLETKGSIQLSFIIFLSSLAVGLQGAKPTQ